MGCDWRRPCPWSKLPISIHAPTWGATHPCSLYPLSKAYFNPRTHVGCDFRRSPQGSHHLISIHAPTWGATIALRGGLEMLYISIHAPTWGATAEPTFCGMTKLFQSTHPRGVRQELQQRYNDARLISIHAPTWGATVGRVLHEPFNDISIHAPTWGATTVTPALRRMREISIHAPTWGATIARVHTSRGDGISIHAPTWGATWGTPSSLRRTNFNPRTHVGCDIRLGIIRAGEPKFQSTHPRGVRLLRPQLRDLVAQFQSTHPRGVRPMPPYLAEHYSEFQSTHPRGVRLKSIIISRRRKRNFNPRTHVGCDSDAVNQRAIYLDFNPRTHVGCDLPPFT